MKIIKIELIDEFMENNKMSKSKFCKVCKISLSSLNKLMTNSLNISVVVLFKIAKILNIEVYQLIS